MGLGKKIRALREHLGLSQAELGKRAQVEQATLSAIETRDSSRSTYLVPLARALGVGLEDLRDRTVQELVAAMSKAPDETTLTAQEPTPLYSVSREMQGRLIRMFQELPPEQQAAFLEEIERTSESNRNIARHYQKHRTLHD